MQRPLLPSFMGTLKSTRMRTRLSGMALAKSGSSTKSLFARDMVDDAEQGADQIAGDLIWISVCVGMQRLMADTNSLGLDFEQEAATEETATEQAANTPEQETKAEKKKPYVNPERVKTGGPQRVGAATC